MDMNTINFLAPLVTVMCIEGYVYNDGLICLREKPRYDRVRYYKPGRSCYVNGDFYVDCKDAPNPFD